MSARRYPPPDPEPAPPIPPEPAGRRTKRRAMVTVIIVTLVIATLFLAFTLWVAFLSPDVVTVSHHEAVPAVPAYDTMSHSRADTGWVWIMGVGGVICAVILAAAMAEEIT